MLPFTKIGQTIQITTIAKRDSGVQSRAIMGLLKLFVNESVADPEGVQGGRSNPLPAAIFRYLMRMK